MAKTFKKVSVVKLTPNFREATKIVEEPFRSSADDEALIKILYSGVNATDVNRSAGRFSASGKMPFDIGLEALGVVHEAGINAKVEPGQFVVVLKTGSYSEYLYAKRNELILIPEPNPEFISFLICGLAASIGLDNKGHIQNGEKVLITAAAGGTGHIAVQWAKQRRCHVIGTCSSKDKTNLLKSLGCDRVINYKEESIDDVLTKEYSDGVDVIWETIGGETTKMLFKHLAKRGRLIIIGGVVGYLKNGFPTLKFQNVPLLLESKTVSGFLLSDYLHLIQDYFQKLHKLFQDGNLKILLDFGQNSPNGPFEGIESVVNGVEHLHSGKNIGKVIIKIQ